jgi:hypothetical protein
VLALPGCEANLPIPDRRRSITMLALRRRRHPQGRLTSPPVRFTSAERAEITRLFRSKLASLRESKGSVTCTINQGEQVIQTATSTGQYVIASCSASV